ncbi:ribonuclease HII [Schizophyllum commune H4-8]|uniref:ribonuclease HII n=1 Tax=Schizophyllum commune (strain H4-8 / FGSC 9210) TaxID=578458 RepID=UPI00215F9826|nr:ribonuclease HII [Schizophyllum commune H4-8]KAI5892697.1 ribonuclease HII [Schizophyllum commune H4-8]
MNSDAEVNGISPATSSTHTVSASTSSTSTPIGASLTPSTSLEPSTSSSTLDTSTSSSSTPLSNLNTSMDEASSAHLHFPLTASYTYHAPIPTASGKYILGVDEAGRGPVLGPLVYGVAYVAETGKERMEAMGFADSKTLDAARREALLETLCSAPDVLGWAVRVISPQALSSGMLRRPPTNLNEQSRDATVMLIRGVLARGIQLSAVFVDALGPTVAYEQWLSQRFPEIKFTVANKADSKFKIVGAASVAAKVTRDALIDGWIYEEDGADAANSASLAADKAAAAAVLADIDAAATEDVAATEEDTVMEDRTANVPPPPASRFPAERGSGYPSDPKTKAWLAAAVEPTFGFPRAVRFSWATSKVILDKHAHAVQWIDDGDAALTAAFQSATGRDKDRCAVTRERGIRSVGAL